MSKKVVDAVVLAGASLASAAVLLGCPWSGLDYLVSGTDAATPDGTASDGSSDAREGGVVPGPGRFETLPIRAQLPADGDCAAWVTAQPTPESVPGNATANQTVPSTEWLSDFRARPLAGCEPNSGPEWCADVRAVTGNFRGTTDMVLRWASCKWGIDEDVTRGLAMEMSAWDMSAQGSPFDSTCQSQNVAPGALNYWFESPPCRRTMGLFKLSLEFVNAFPYARTSTALNADVALGQLRSCINGRAPLAATTKNTAFGPYPPTDRDLALWGCIAYSHYGEWAAADAATFVDEIKSTIANRTWPH